MPTLIDRTQIVPGAVIPKEATDADPSNKGGYYVDRVNGNYTTLLYRSSQKIMTVGACKIVGSTQCYIEIDPHAVALDTDNKVSEAEAKLKKVGL